MTLSLAVNSRNDLTVGADGKLSMSKDLPAIMQAAQHAAQTLLGEMIYAADQGMPQFEVVWSGAPNVAQFEAYLRRTLLAVDGVQQIAQLTTTVNANALSYRVVIQTVFGTAVLNG